jgi:predicted transcriptional regulator of viral defense system
MAVRDILKTIETPYVDAQTLLALLTDYQKPREWISRMVKNKELMRLKNGFYLIADKIRQGTNILIPYEQIANLLYGPSYVSLEWALSFYGMIPERVHTVTSMTLGKNKEYHTPIGDFVYYKLSPDGYSIGITQKKVSESQGGFLMASPEKALADLVFKTCKGLNKEGVRQELLESKRIDREHFHQLDKILLGEIAKSYRVKSVDYLADLVGVL